MDSGIIPRVRELKASLGESIYHPGVLATLAPYNAAFGERFRRLFSAATEEIKDFAQTTRRTGRQYPERTVDGVEVTVDHVAAMNQEALLQIDYSRGSGKIPPRLTTKERIGTPAADAAVAGSDSAPHPRKSGNRVAAMAAPALAAGPARPNMCRRRLLRRQSRWKKRSCASGGIDSCFRARGRSQIPPDRAHALFQSDARSCRGRRLHRRLSRTNTARGPMRRAILLRLVAMYGAHRRLRWKNSSAHEAPARSGSCTPILWLVLIDLTQASCLKVLPGSPRRPTVGDAVKRRADVIVRKNCDSGLLTARLIVEAVESAQMPRCRDMQSQTKGTSDRPSLF